MSGCRRAARPLLLDCQCLAIVSACKRQNQDTFLGHRIRFYLDQYAFKSLPSDGKPFALDAQGCGHGTKPIKNSHFNFQRRIIGIDALAIHVNSPVHPPKITFGRHGLLGCSGIEKQLLCGKFYMICIINTNRVGYFLMTACQQSNKLKMRLFSYQYGFDFPCNIKRFFNKRKGESFRNGEIGCRSAVCGHRKNVQIVKTNERKPGTRNFLSYEISCYSRSETTCRSTP